jgi:outer membrane murein-binding lipoprotein Lpp
MNRSLLALALLAACPLAGCSDEPENIQAKAENMSRMIENKADILENEAANTVDAAIAPLENEAEALLNQANDAGPVPDNGTGNRAGR